MSHFAFAGVVVAILLVISPASGSALDVGTLLSPDDYVFLATQGVERDNSVLQKMSPKELRGLHHVINDLRTQSDPQSRAEAVAKALADFEVNQRWETENPGHLWDEKKPPAPNHVRPD